MSGHLLYERYQRIWRAGVGIMGASRTPRSANQWTDVDDVPIDVVDLVFDRCRGRGRQRGRNGGREVAREPGSAFGVDVDTQPSRVLASGGVESGAVAPLERFPGPSARSMSNPRGVSRAENVAADAGNAAAAIPQPTIAPTRIIRLGAWGAAFMRYPPFLE
jgi:hypothetical protein